MADPLGHGHEARVIELFGFGFNDLERVESAHQDHGGRVRRAREPVARKVIQKVKLTEEERDQLRARAAELAPGA